ncbi:MAG: beta-lactamase family protein, partial [Gammaproteobacteria bacterium]|nr:beta-lactamase family protein [Gammaproteobacteria bacterium]
MAKILYLTTNHTNVDISHITAKLADSRAEDIDVRKINSIENIEHMDASEYFLVIISDQSSIPPWKIINELRKKINIDNEPVFWVEGDLNSITKQYLQSEGLTGSVLVTRESKELIAACNGRVDGKQDSKANEIVMETQHNICSIGKMLTGLTVLKLVQEGMLSLDDPIGKYLPDSFPEKEKFRWNTIRQLVTHTARIGNYTSKYNIALNSSKEAPHLKKLEDFSPYIEHDHNLKPGEYKYSNVGFVVLGEIIEQVINKDISEEEKKKSYWDAINEYILTPSGITITRDTPLYDLPFATNRDFKKNLEIASSPAGANMWATPEALSKFGDWLIQQLNTDQDIEKQIKATEVDTRHGTKYAFGMMHPIPDNDIYLTDKF